MRLSFRSCLCLPHPVHLTLCMVNIGLCFARLDARSPEYILSCQPEAGSPQAEIFKSLEYVFALCFGVELVINLFGSWFWPFVGNRWNLFDCIVVGVSFAGLFQPDLPGTQIIRFIRVFRVVKLVRWDPSLRCVCALVSLSLCQPPVHPLSLPHALPLPLSLSVFTRAWHDCEADKCDGMLR